MVTMKTIVVISLDMSSPADIVTVLDHIDPPSIPFFSGDVRISVGDDAKHVIDWLDEDGEL